MGSTLNMDENTRPIPQDSMNMLRDQAIFGPDAAVELFVVESQDPGS